MSRFQRFVRASMLAIVGAGFVIGLTSLRYPAEAQQAVAVFLNNSGTSVRMAANASGQALVSLASGIVSVANGGTGLSSGTSGGVPYFNSTTTMASSAALASGLPVVGGGAGAAPATITCAAGTVLAGGSPPSCTATPTVTNVTSTAGTGSQTGKSCITVYSNVDTTGSSTGGNIDYATWTVPANTMSADGQRLEISSCALHAANTNAVVFQLMAFGTAINGSSSADSGGLACLKHSIVRASSTTAIVNGFTFASGGFTQNRIRVTSLDFTGSTTINLRFQTSTANNDLTGLYSHIMWCPAS